MLFKRQTASVTRADALATMTTEIGAAISKAAGHHVTVVPSQISSNSSRGRNAFAIAWSGRCYRLSMQYHCNCNSGCSGRCMSEWDLPSASQRCRLENSATMY